MAQLPSSPPPRLEIQRVSSSYLAALFALCPLLMLYWWLQPDLLSQGVLDGLNALLPIYFLVVMTYLAWRTMGAMPAAIWTTLVWYPINSAVFYGFGPLVQVYGNEITRATISSHFLGISEQELFRAHKLSVTGIAMGLLGLTAHMTLRRKAWTWVPDSRASGPVFDIVKLGLVFLVTGAVFKYLVLKPAQWGVLSLTVPGVLSGLGNLIDLGFAVIAYCAGRGSRSVRPILWIGLPLHVFLSLLTMSKSEVVLPLLLSAIGYYAGSGRAGVLVRHLILIALLLSTLQPWVHHGRAVISERTGSIDLAGYGERLDILGEFFLSGSTAETEEQGDDVQGWWRRLNFSGPQSQAMELYDRGFNNSSLHQAWVYFIPRAIWPDKPILTGPGRDFYRLLTGNEEAQSFLGLSIYGDLYWQFGWSGVLIGCCLFGWLLGIIASRALRAVRNQEFVMLPFIMMALELGLASPNKYVLNGIIGPLPIMIFYYAALSGLLWLVRGLPVRPRAEGPAGPGMTRRF